VCTVGIQFCFTVIVDYSSTFELFIVFVLNNSYYIGAKTWNRIATGIDLTLPGPLHYENARSWFKHCEVCVRWNDLVFPVDTLKDWAWAMNHWGDNQVDTCQHLTQLYSDIGGQDSITRGHLQLASVMGHYNLESREHLLPILRKCIPTLTQSPRVIQAAYITGKVRTHTIVILLDSNTLYSVLPFNTFNQNIKSDGQVLHTFHWCHADWGCTWRLLNHLCFYCCRQLAILGCDFLTKHGFIIDIDSPWMSTSDYNWIYSLEEPDQSLAVNQLLIMNYQKLPFNSP